MCDIFVNCTRLLSSLTGNETFVREQKNEARSNNIKSIGVPLYSWLYRVLVKYWLSKNGMSYIFLNSYLYYIFKYYFENDNEYAPGMENKWWESKLVEFQSD